MKVVNLFDDDEAQQRSDGDEARDATEATSPLQYNQSYAQKYERRKRGEELMKLRDKYGEDFEPSESEEDFSSEDSDAEFLTPEVDAAILKTLARIKKADSKLYEGQDDVFQETQNSIGRAEKTNTTLPSSRHQKPMHLRDYHRKALLAHGGRDLDGGDDPNLRLPTAAEEAEALREETKRAFHALDNAEEESDAGWGEMDDLLIPREKQPGELETEEHNYQSFLLEQVGSEDIQLALRMSPNRQTECDPDQADETFLQNYLLGRGWIDKEAKKIPSYKELVQPKIKSKSTSQSDEIAGKTVIDEDFDEEDEEFVEKAEEFETKYNFRFEDANPTISTHARDMGDSVRRKDESRKLNREAVKSRKEEEKQQRMEELQRLKQLKKKEIIEKLDVIRKNAGDVGCNLSDLNLDSDFDPEGHDQQMQKVFDNEFYNKTDPDGKPVWDDEIEIDDVILSGHGDHKTTDFRPGGDAYDPSVPSKKASKRDKREKRKQKKRHRVEDDKSNPELLLEHSAAEDPHAEGKEKTLLEALEEYHQLDCEDMIGDLPTRFKYTKVEPNNLLTPNQILMATDKELGEIIGLKKLAPYWSAPDEKLANRKRKLKELREKLKDRSWGVAPLPQSSLEKSASSRPSKKRKGKKERSKLKTAQNLSSSNVQLE
ncbi:hypothetical protein O181_063037 [Austropuccinia psidii MF-1]|uniref:Kri1-like C-terminal domain-containing protein n=1 Tax=Austropuccinia psidii MF-1 TaxID=1389203 RepID=A0A9Q3ET98_9BASI|nr:hypothetical protein [Austropuccinia psidii MF-1]